MPQPSPACRGRTGAELGRQNTSPSATKWVPRRRSRSSCHLWPPISAPSPPAGRPGHTASPCPLPSPETSLTRAHDRPLAHVSSKHNLKELSHKTRKNKKKRKRKRGRRCQQGGQRSPHAHIVLLASRGHTASNLKPILPPGLTRERGGPTEQPCRLPARLRSPAPAGGGPAAGPAPQAPGPMPPLGWGGQRSPRDHPRDHPTHSRVKARRRAPGSLLASCPSGPINTGNYISPLLSLGSQKYELFLLALAVSNNSSSPW